MAAVKAAKPLPKTVNDGQRQLRSSGLSLKQIGDAAGASKQAASEWLSGGSRPSGERLERLVAAGFISDAQAFERAPGAPRPPVAPTQVALAASPVPAPRTPAPRRCRVPSDPPPTPYEPVDVDLEAPGAARVLVIAQLRRLQADTARLRAASASDDAIRKAEEAERKASLHLAKLAGELNPTEEQRLVKSVKWYSIRETILKALEPHPDALRAVRDALAGEDV